MMIGMAILCLALVTALLAGLLVRRRQLAFWGLRWDQNLSYMAIMRRAMRYLRHGGIRVRFITHPYFSMEIGTKTGYIQVATHGGPDELLPVQVKDIAGIRLKYDPDKSCMILTTVPISNKLRRDCVSCLVPILHTSELDELIKFLSDPPVEFDTELKRRFLGIEPLPPLVDAVSEAQSPSKPEPVPTPSAPQFRFAGAVDDVAWEGRLLGWAICLNDPTRVPDLAVRLNDANREFSLERFGRPDLKDFPCNSAGFRLTLQSPVLPEVWRRGDLSVVVTNSGGAPVALKITSKATEKLAALQHAANAPNE